MSQPVLTIFYQFDPLHPTIGGIQTCIRYIIKYVPRDIDLRIVGVTSDASLTVGTWHPFELFDRPFQFMPLFYLENDNVRGLIPTTVRYTAALLNHQIHSDFLQFHRIEPTLATFRWSGHKILYIHNDIYREVKGEGQGGILWRRLPWLYFALERLLVSQFNHIFSCNSDSAALYQQRYPEIADRVSYLTNTIDSDLFYPLTSVERQQGKQQMAEQLNLPKETKFVLFAGRLHPQKDPRLLIRSLAALNNPGVHLLVVGDGELKEEMGFAIAHLQLTAQVTFLGSIQQSELANLYRICDVFVLTSVYEGLARGSIEALACGTPVVTTRAGETPRFLSSDAGIVCEERTPAAIAAALGQVLQNPASYPAEACVRVAQPFDAKQVVSTTYTNLLRYWRSQSDHNETVSSQPKVAL